jgi:hypothetical protein
VERLEEEAVNLVGFSDYILDHIKDSRDKGRWLSAAELKALVEDFFARNFPGTKIEPVAKIEHAVRIVLSDDAGRALGYFIAETKPSTRTTLHRSSRPILCMFDPRRTEDTPPGAEFIEPSHPLVQWIRSWYEANQEQLHPVTAIKITSDDAAVLPGDYIFSAHRWSFNGLKSDQLLAFRAVRFGDGRPLSAAESESLVATASRMGEAIPNAINVLPDIGRICEAAVTCEEALEHAFGERLSDFEAENKVRCDQQRTSAEKLAKRRLDGLHARIARFRSEENIRPIAMTEGLIRKEQEQLQTKLDRIARRQQVDPTMIQLAVGVIRVL